MSLCHKGGKAPSLLTRQRIPGRKPAKSENSVFPCGQDGPKRSILVSRHRRASSVGALKQGPLREKSAFFWMCIMIREQTMGRSSFRAAAFDAEAYKTFKQLTGARSGGWSGPFSWGRMAAVGTISSARVASIPASRASGRFSSPVPITSPHARKSVQIRAENGLRSFVTAFPGAALMISHAGLSL